MYSLINCISTFCYGHKELWAAEAVCIAVDIHIMDRYEYTKRQKELWSLGFLAEAGAKLSGVGRYLRPFFVRLLSN